MVLAPKERNFGGIDTPTPSVGDGILESYNSLRRNGLAPKPRLHSLKFQIGVALYQNVCSDSSSNTRLHTTSAPRTYSNINSIKISNIPAFFSGGNWDCRRNRKYWINSDSPCWHFRSRSKVWRDSRWLGRALLSRLPSRYLLTDKTKYLSALLTNKNNINLSQVQEKVQWALPQGVVSPVRSNYLNCCRCGSVSQVQAIARSAMLLLAARIQRVARFEHS